MIAATITVFFARILFDQFLDQTRCLEFVEGFDRCVEAILGQLFDLVFVEPVCVASLREQTAQLCQDMLHSINSSETGVHQKTLNRLVRFIDQFKQMNFVNDRVMEEQLERVKKELLTRSAEEYRDSRTARKRLVEGLGQLANHAQQLAKQDASELVQRFGQMGHRKFNLAA